MVNYWLLGDLVLFALLLATAFVWLKGMLTYLSALTSGVSFYVVDQSTDTNIRSAQQAEFLSAFVAQRDRAAGIVLFSTLVIAVIVFARHLLEVVHAAV